MPMLFSIFFSMILQHAIKDLDDEDGVYIRYGTDGSLFNLRRLQAYTKISEQLIRELLFADELVAHSEAALQRVTSYFAELFGALRNGGERRRLKFSTSHLLRKTTILLASPSTRQS